MSKKEIESLKNQINTIIDFANHRIIIAIIIGILVIFSIFCIWASLANSEWQCTPDGWEETDELVDCEEYNMGYEYKQHRFRINETEVLSLNCQDIFGSGWYSFNYPYYPDCEILGYDLKSKERFGLCKCKKDKPIKIVCEHKKVCTQEMLVREVKKRNIPQ